MPKSLDGLHPTLMRPRVEALLADPEAQALGVFVMSAGRSDEYQAKLFDNAVIKYGSEREAAKWVARPGRSKHGPRVLHTDGKKYGIAVDLGVRGVRSLRGQWPDDIEQQVNALAARHGLASPLEWEDWHFEPIPDWPTAAPAPSPLEDEMIPADTIVATLICTVPYCPWGWWELRADGAVVTEGTEEHKAHHYFGSIHEAWMEPHRPPHARFTAIGPRRGAPGYTTWGYQGETRVFYEFGPGVGPVPA